MPQRHPCPHCPDGFINDHTLQTHIHFVHNGGASQPPRPKPLVWTPSTTIASCNEPNTGPSSVVHVAWPSPENRARLSNTSTSTEAAVAEGGGYGEYRPTLRRRQALRGASAGPLLDILTTGVRTTGRPCDPETQTFVQEQLAINQSITPTPMLRSGFREPPLGNAPNTTDTPRAVRQAMRSAELRSSISEKQRRRSASPDRSGIPVSPPASKFIVVYECQEAGVQQRLEVPTSASWQSFTALLQGASALVAGAYIVGRATGFTLDDGPWRYAFVDFEGVSEDRWRLLTSNLLYRAMISELVIHPAVWTHVSVRHVSLTAC